MAKSPEDEYLEIFPEEKTTPNPKDLEKSTNLNEEFFNKKSASNLFKETSDLVKSIEEATQEGAKELAQNNLKTFLNSYKSQGDKATEFLLKILKNAVENISNRDLVILLQDLNDFNHQYDRPTSMVRAKYHNYNVVNSVDEKVLRFKNSLINKIKHTHYIPGGYSKEFVEFLERTKIEENFAAKKITPQASKPQVAKKTPAKKPVQETRLPNKKTPTEEFSQEIQALNDAASQQYKFDKVARQELIAEMIKKLQDGKDKGQLAQIYVYNYSNRDGDLDPIAAFLVKSANDFLVQKGGAKVIEQIFAIANKYEKSAKNQNQDSPLSECEKLLAISKEVSELDLDSDAANGVKKYAAKFHQDNMKKLADISTQFFQELEEGAKTPPKTQEEEKTPPKNDLSTEKEVPVLGKEGAKAMAQIALVGALMATGVGTLVIAAVASGLLAYNLLKKDKSGEKEKIRQELLDEAKENMSTEEFGKFENALGGESTLKTPKMTSNPVADVTDLLGDAGEGLKLASQNLEEASELAGDKSRQEPQNSSEIQESLEKDEAQKEAIQGGEIRSLDQLVANPLVEEKDPVKESGNPRSLTKEDAKKSPPKGESPQSSIDQAPEKSLKRKPSWVERTSPKKQSPSNDLEQKQ